ncbi:phosphoadenylyl-sulfate reductase [Fluviicola taffensis]|uniref:Adenosine 5'-phosphosulfate reductase n=1 Tax=Fluviicola taffensis (strain DSM 16823 / NCIMB 13979 / RW262) TaxID=755732 RepID=F2IHS8_FLUTR|nr:phosphoadenylyl-sulfate reductase [Fluviicola taffensis]AEA45887.1 phosphoadenylylsulfate reductase (thioredoxin) [Fluviicola taffensis DSM 16823]
MIEKIKAIAYTNLEDYLSRIASIERVKVAFSSSLSWEDQVLTHAIYSQELPIRVFTLDTGRLFPETYSVIESTRQRYQKKLEVYFPQSQAVENLLTEKGPLSFYESLENRKECCFIRKVEPLNRALKDVDVWITGLRADHSENRAGLELVEWDEQRRIVKVNPLANWSLEEVKEYIKQYNIPYNVLQDKGFISLGCQPCTRAIREGESFRAGRWWWEDNSKKECGLHS